MWGLSVLLYISLCLRNKKPFNAFHVRNTLYGFPKRNDLSITYPYDGEYDSGNIGLSRWCSINETATLIGNRY